MRSREARSERPTQLPAINGADSLRAASTGLTVLFVGGALAKIVAIFVPTSQLWWLPLVAMIGYAVAGSRIGNAGRPTLQGALAGLLAWALVAIGRLGWGFAGYTPALTFVELLPAIAIGALAGWMAGRRAEQAAAVRREREVEQRRARAAGKAARRTTRHAADRPRGSGRPGS